MSGSANNETIERLSNVLADVSESLAELCQDLLLDAIHGNNDSVSLEKEIQKARRAVAKAEQVLRGLTHPTDD